MGPNGTAENPSMGRREYASLEQLYYFLDKTGVMENFVSTMHELDRNVERDGVMDSGITWVQEQ